MKSATRNGGDPKRPVTIIGLEGSANKIGIGIVRDGEVRGNLGTRNSGRQALKVHK